MKRVIYEKFRQNQDLKRNLIQASEATLASKQLENGNYRGENQVGKILEEVREAFSGVKACPTAVSKPTPKINPSCTQGKSVASAPESTAALNLNIEHYLQSTSQSNHGAIPKHSRNNTWDALSGNIRQFKPWYS